MIHPEYNFTSHFMEVGEHRLHYLDEGDGPVIVAVHGNPTWSFYYRNVIHNFSTRYRIIALDNMGCGLSDKPQNYDYSLAQHIENLTTVLRRLQIKRCSLLVHDWGGAIGMGYAVRHPEAIEKIAILNTAAFRSQKIPFRIALCRIPMLGALLVKGVNGFAWPATFMAVAKPLCSATKRAYLMPYNSWKNRIAIHRFVQDIPLESSHPSYPALVEIEKGLKRLRDMEIPMAILWGGRDFCFTADFYDEWCRRFPSAEAHFFEDCGHYLLEDCRSEVLQRLEEFFDGTS
jgi:haloalkane dehalogenase